MSQGSTVPLPPDIRHEIKGELRAHLLDLVRTGRDVVLDFSFWSRQMRAANPGRRSA